MATGTVTNMIQLKEAAKYKAYGFTQEYHRTPMYRILYAIKHLRDNEKLATAPRIGKEINKYGQYVTNMLYWYWDWNFVSRKPVKTPKNKTRKAENASWHWVLTKPGLDKLKRLQQEFGEMEVLP